MYHVSRYHDVIISTYRPALPRPTKSRIESEKHYGTTDLVHLTIGSIANHFHQLKDTCWILERNKNIVKTTKEGQRV